MIVILELFAEVTKQHLVQVNRVATAATYQVMMGVTLRRLIVRLFAREMAFTDQAQLAQKLQGTIDRREAHIGVALLHAFRDLFYAQVFVGLLNDAQDHMALWRQSIALLTEQFVARSDEMMHGVALFLFYEWHITCTHILTLRLIRVNNG
jgi:hypothetical protein